MHNRLTTILDDSTPSVDTLTSPQSPAFPKAGAPPHDTPPAFDPTDLLDDYLTGDLSLRDLAARHELRVRELLDILESPEIIAILDRMIAAAELQAQRLATLARPQAVARLADLARTDPADHRLLSPAIEARSRETTRKAAAALLRAPPRPPAKPRTPQPAPPPTSPAAPQKRKTIKSCQAVALGCACSSVHHSPNARNMTDALPQPTPHPLRAAASPREPPQHRSPAPRRGPGPHRLRDLVP